MATAKTGWADRAFVAITALLGLAFVAAGTTKLLALPMQVANFAGWGYPSWFMYFTGIVEVVGGVLLWVPRTRTVGAVIMAATMCCAVLTHLQAHEYGRVAPSAVFLTLLLAYLVRQRRAPQSRSASA